MTRETLRRTLAGLLLAAAIPACGPMQMTGADASDTHVQADGSDTVNTTETGTDVVRDTPAMDAGTDSATTDVQSDVVAVDANDTDGSDAVAMDAITTDTITSDTTTSDASDGGTMTSCPTTMPLTLGGMVSGTLSGASQFDSTQCQADATGPEQVYTLHIDSMTGVAFNTGGMLDTIVSVRTACADATSEIACDDDGGAGVLSSLRTVLMPGDYFVIVDQFGGGTGGAYTLSASPFTPAANSDCAMATTFSDTMPATGDTNAAVSRATSCSRFNEGPVLYYSITVPANTRATLTAMPGGTPAWTPVVRVQDMCTSTACVVNAAATMAGGNAVVTVDNRGTTPRTYLVSVGSTTSATGGMFTLSAAFATLPTTANAMCSNAIMVADGTMLATEDANLGADTLATSCLATAVGRVLYYRATIPAGDVLTVTGTPNSAWDLVLRLLDACGATTCLGSANARTGGGAETLRFVNTGTSARDVIIAVGSNSAITTGTFALAVTITPQPVNATCATPTAVVDGTMLAGENASLATTSLTSACGTAPGGNLFYSATIPAGNVLTVTATPGGAWDPAIRVIDTCGATSCRASSDTRGAGAAETLRYTNTTTGALNVIIAVGADSATTSGTYSLTVQIRPLPYAESLIGTSCDDMTAAPAVAGITGDDTVSAIAALPFTFQFMGTAATHYSVNSNGLIQLWPSTAGTPSNQWANVAIPNTGTPNGFVAPFWDDLIPDATSSVVAGEVTSGPRHFTVQWTNFGFVADTSTAMTARITMQAKFFETTNRIEFHYCSVTPVGTSTFTSGSSATVGVENAAGDNGFQHSYNAASSVDTTNAIVLTPVP